MADQNAGVQDAVVSVAKSKAEAEKAAADALKARVDAEVAALKARIGEVPASGYKGDVTFKDKEGAIEAALLATRAARKAAAWIAEAVSAVVGASAEEGTSRPEVLLFGSGEVPTFQALLAFRGQALAVRAALDAAIELSKREDARAELSKPSMKVAAGVVGVLGAVGLGLDAVSKLLGYFKTDYQVAGVELSFDDSLLLQALAGMLAGSCDLWQPALYNAAALHAPATRFLVELADLSRLEADARERTARHEKRAAELTTKAAASEKDEPTKKKLEEDAARHQKLADRLKAATTLADALVTKLGTADDKGGIPLATAVREAAAFDALAGGAFLLVVKLHRAGGAFYSKSGVIIERKMPLYHMGGVVAGFVLLDGVSGRVVASDVVPIHGGFMNSDDLADAAWNREGDAKDREAAWTPDPKMLAKMTTSGRRAAHAGRARASKGAGHGLKAAANGKTTVTIRMTSGNYVCTGEVHRFGGGDPIGPVEVRSTQSSSALPLEAPGHYQYAFRAMRGSGPFTLDAKDAQGLALGTRSYTGELLEGLILDIEA